MRDIEKIILTIEYIEENLTEKLEWKTIADAVSLSPYHLHRTFSLKTGLSPHRYLKRRQLTEAAKMLLSSDRSILDIAFLTGYESQQAFTRSFNSLYKCPPSVFRRRGIFYPLQHRFNFSLNFELPDEANQNIPWKIKWAQKEDISSWMKLSQLVIDGYPCFDETEYRQILAHYIDKKQALLAKDGDRVIGNMLISPSSGRIDFFGVHPLYRRTSLAKTFIQKVVEELSPGRDISITTYRAGDKADTGYRQTLQNLGFSASEMLVEFGYPTQKFLFPKNNSQKVVLYG